MCCDGVVVRFLACKKSILETSRVARFPDIGIRGRGAEVGGGEDAPRTCRAGGGSEVGGWGGAVGDVVRWVGGGLAVDEQQRRVGVRWREDAETPPVGVPVGWQCLEQLSGVQAEH